MILIPCHLSPDHGPRAGRVDSMYKRCSAPDRQPTVLPVNGFQKGEGGSSKWNYIPFEVLYFRFLFKPSFSKVEKALAIAATFKCYLPTSSRNSTLPRGPVQALLKEIIPKVYNNI